MNGWRLFELIYWSAAAWFLYRAWRWALKVQPNRTPPPRLPAPPPDRCSDPPCSPEDNWTCGHHATIAVARLIADAEHYANDQANHA